eukprot:6424746-Amphidinium_carterae.1
MKTLHSTASFPVIIDVNSDLIFVNITLTLTVSNNGTHSRGDTSNRGNVSSRIGNYTGNRTNRSDSTTKRNGNSQPSGICTQIDRSVSENGLDGGKLPG